METDATDSKLPGLETSSPAPPAAFSEEETQQESARESTRPKPSEQPNSEVGRSAARKIRLSYVPREDATPEGELAALRNAYRFVIEHAQNRKATGGEES